MGSMGEEFLPCPRFTRDQDRQVAQWADPANRLEDGHNRLTLSNTPDLPHGVFDTLLLVPSPGFSSEMLGEYVSQLLGNLSLRTIK
jgi:hypothetical protein